MGEVQGDAELNRVRVGIRAFSDLCEIIGVALRRSNGESVEAPKLQTREGRFLYEELLAPQMGLPVNSGVPVDPSRLDESVRDLIGVRERSARAEVSVAREDVPASGVVGSYTSLAPFVDAFLLGTLDPCSQQYSALMRIVDVYAMNHNVGRLLPNNPFDRKTA